MTGKGDAYSSAFVFFGSFFGALDDTQLGDGLPGVRPLALFAAFAAFFRTPSLDVESHLTGSSVCGQTHP